MPEIKLEIRNIVIKIIAMICLNDFSRFVSH